MSDQPAITIRVDDDEYTLVPEQSDPGRARGFVRIGSARKAIALPGVYTVDRWGVWTNDTTKHRLARAKR